MKMETSAVCLLVLVAASTLRVTSGRPSGAPIAACSTLTPEHDTVPQPCSKSCGFNLTLKRSGADTQPSLRTYGCGENHTVILSSSTDTFRGFLVQSRASTELFTPEATFLGVFHTLSPARLLQCEDFLGDSITHVDSTDKRSVEFIWTAPSIDRAQPVTFWYTIVVNYSEIYVQLSETFFPDEISCSFLQTIPPVGFSLPPGPLVVEEGDSLSVCVQKEGQTEQTVSVRITTVSIDDGIAATPNVDYQELDSVLEFRPEDFVMCVSINSTTDSTFEGLEPLAVFVHFLSQIIASVRVDIIDRCPGDDFLCVGEPLCIPQDRVCDGVPDCLFKQDEFFCDNAPCDREGSVRLTGGSTSQEGLVELCHKGQYSSICLEEVSLSQATFVCTELGFTGGGVWFSAWREYQTVGSGAILQDCTGNKTHPIRCTYSAPTVSGCSHINDAGIRCQDQPACEHGSVRLVGDNEREGMVQLCIFGAWGPISSNQWRFSEASVVCRSLGYDDLGALPIPRVPYSNTSSDDMVFADGVYCDGSESSLLECSLDLQGNGITYSDYVVGVRCEAPPSACGNGDVHLRQRDSEAHGLVEVCIEGAWAPVCSSGWDEADATVVCRQLNRTAVGDTSYFEEAPRSEIGGLEFLQCTGNETNLLECLRVNPNEEKRQSLCSLVAGVRCSEIPRIIPSPPVADGSYNLEVQRDVGRSIQCLLYPNLYYPEPFNFTSYRVTPGNELIQLETTSGGNIVTILGDDSTVSNADFAGTYLCKAENAVGSSNYTININVLFPSGPMSRVYIRLSIPRAQDRLIIIFQYEVVQDILSAMETFLLLEGLDPERSPGQQAVHCTKANRTQDDELRLRDRYECTLDNHPPLEGRPTALAETAAHFMEAQTFAISDIQISVSGFCDSEPSVYGGVWPEIEAGNTVSLPCEGGTVTRECSLENGGQWLSPNDSQCARITITPPTISPSAVPPTISPSTVPPTISPSTVPPTISPSTVPPTISPSTVPPTISPSTVPPTKSTEFHCESENQSLPLERRCDGVGHCLFLEDEAQCPPVVTGCSNGEVRLTQGISANDGIVEYCVGGAWGTMCQRSFSAENAKVACRQLGLPESAATLSNVQSLVPAHTITVTCNGLESSLGECQSSSQGQGCVEDFFSRAAIRCQAPVECENGELCLIGGAGEREGNLQICFNQVWGSVCHNQGEFSTNEARVSCSQLGYNPSGALVLPDGYLAFNRSFIPFISNIDCPYGNESRVIDCELGGEGGGQCQPVQIRCDAYPTDNCVNGSVRLIDRRHTSEGMLELCLDGQWGTLCDPFEFSDNEASVVCRQLGFSPEGSFSYGERRRDGAVLHRLYFACNGTEESLFDCDSLQVDDECSLSLYLVCLTSPSLYLSPPPLIRDDALTYFVEDRQPLDIDCRTESTRPPSRTIGYRRGNGSAEMCQSGNENVDFNVIDTSVDTEGEYQCVSCNSIGTVILNFRVEILEPEGEGSSVILRLSAPVLERLSEVIQGNVSREDILPGLESLLYETEVIIEADGIQTIECRSVEKTPADIETQRDRYECNITTYPPTDTGKQLVERMANEIRRENIAITSAFLISETGFCDSEVDETDWGTYPWAETFGGAQAALTCMEDSSISVTRECLAGGRWDEPAYGGCALLGLTGGFRDEDLGTTSGFVAAAVQTAEQTDENVELVREYFFARAEFVLNNASRVDEEFVGNVIDVLSELQEWPEESLQSEDSGARIVQSFEVIAISLTQQENFTELEVEDENIAVRIENVNVNELSTGRSFGVSEGDGTLDATVGSESALAPDQIASGFLPLSLFELAGLKQEDGEPVPVVFAILRNGSLFSIERNQGRNEGVSTAVGSPVVSLTVGLSKTFTNLPDPVIINVRIQVENFTNPRCVSYDFDLQEWVTDGCVTILTPGSNQITCECDHLTNFASLVDVCSRTEGNCGHTEDTRLALDIISIVGVILSGVGLILTIVTLLVFKKLRKRDASKFHIQLSLALLGMLVVFVVGIDRTKVFEGCVTVSVLIHYFTLVAVMWMGAEALLMFQKLVIVFVQITTRYIVIVSLVCWLAPIIPAILSAAIDPELVITDTDTEKFCFIGDARVFFVAFLGPIFAVLLFNLIIYIIVIVVLIKHSRNKLGKAMNDKKQRKSNIRLAVSLLGVMILFGLTWVLGAFTISEASLTFQFLFAVFNSLQGFFIFIFFCVLSPEVRQLWLETVTCGRYVASKPSSYSGAKKSYSTGLRSGAKQTNPSTASSGLSSFPSGHYASESSVAIELSENPSSTVIDNEYTLSGPSMDQEQTGSQHSNNNKLPRVVGPPTSSHAHFYKNPSAAGEEPSADGRRAGSSGLGAFESMRISVEFK